MNDHGIQSRVAKAVYLRAPRTLYAAFGNMLSILLITYRGKYRPDVLGMAPHQLRLKTDASLSLFIRLEWDLVQHNLACETIANSLRIA